jgi:hypothetical protein
MNEEEERKQETSEEKNEEDRKSRVEQVRGREAQNRGDWGKAKSFNLLGISHPSKVISVLAK